jgi:hypothetical protein
MVLSKVLLVSALSGLLFPLAALSDTFIDFGEIGADQRVPVDRGTDVCGPDRGRGG